MTTERNSPFKSSFEVLGVHGILEVPVAIPQADELFVLFVAIDARAVPDADLRRAARELLTRGMVYACVWGDDCSRVHDQIDLERDENEPAGKVVMTTDHADETIREAFEYFIDLAWPDDGFLSRPWRRIAVSVNNDAWRTSMQGFR